MSTPSDLFAGRYQIESELGRGTFGSVHRAIDTRLLRPVALKIPHRLLASDPEFLATFSHEAQTAAALAHPNIVTVYDVGEGEDGLPYLAMRFLEGRSLRQILLDEGRPPLDRSLHILDQLADALDYLHDQRLVHRDIKPANVMVDADGNTTLMDFGLARSLSGTHLSLTTGVLAFTPLYASPEQVAGKRLSPASDRYSFAVVVYETLTGAAPHAGFDSQVLLHAIRFEPPPPADQINRELPPEAGRALLEALAKQPEDRPASTRAIMRDLRLALAGRRSLPGAELRSARASETREAERPVATPTTVPLAPIHPAAETIVQVNRGPAAPPSPPPEPVALPVPDRSVPVPAPVAPPDRTPGELRHYAEAGVQRVEVFGRGGEICPTCRIVQAQVYAIAGAPLLPVRGCSAVWGCHCEYAPVAPAGQELPVLLVAQLNPGQRSRLELQRLRQACARGEAAGIEILAERDACLVCQDAAHAYPPEQAPTLPLFACRRYPPCDAEYRLVRAGATASDGSFKDALRRLDARLKRKGWPWQ